MPSYAAGDTGHLGVHNADTRGNLGYAQVVATQGSITTEVDLTGLTVTVTVGSGRRIRITAKVQFSSSVNNDIAAVKISEGGTQLQQGSASLSGGGGAGNDMMTAAVLTPSAGAHTYKLRGIRAAGTGTVTLQASATAPAFILVEDIGV